jgi:hypothetical protein
MKTVYDLSPDEMQELKARYLDEHLLEVEDRTASYGELANAADIVPDGIIFEAYAGIMFVDDDFFCNEKEG